MSRALSDMDWRGKLHRQSPVARSEHTRSWDVIMFCTHRGTTALH